MADPMLHSVPVTNTAQGKPRVSQHSQPVKPKLNTIHSPTCMIRSDPVQNTITEHEATIAQLRRPDLGEKTGRSSDSPKPNVLWSIRQVDSRMNSKGRHRDEFKGPSFGFKSSSKRMRRLLNVQMATKMKEDVLEVMQHTNDQLRGWVETVGRTMSIRWNGLSARQKGSKATQRYDLSDDWGNSRLRVTVVISLCMISRLSL